MINFESLIKHDELLSSTRANICEFLSCDGLPNWAHNSILELIEAGEYDELNDRFFKTSEFGTGGIRGRTVGKILPKSEYANSNTQVPEHASVGSIYVNDFNIIRATIALFRYCRIFLNAHKYTHKQPTLVVSYDTRFFSKYFCELCASTWGKLGGYAMIFDGPRSTPQLSFSVRYLHATAGVMITASHNPWHDNGFKAYFSDGAQMVEPHASGVIAQYNEITLSEVIKHLTIDLSHVMVLDNYVDDAYLSTVAETVIDSELLRNSSPSVVFTPLHGVGAISTFPLLNRFGINYSVVDKQNDQDSMFSTVKSPNPENKEALKLAIDKAEADLADIVLATDPDGDRVAIAARNKAGEFECFSGNVAWAMLIDYRLSVLYEKGILNSENCENAAIIKTFVTTPLIEKIAKSYHVKCVNTLTGFKWIGEKINDYEQDLYQKIFSQQNGLSINYDTTDVVKRLELLLENSTFFVFGCEESYGCLSSDVVRDKDANSAVLMLCELAAYAKKNKLTLCDLRDKMFKKYGYFGESVLNIYYDGADGSKKISNILNSYRMQCPKIVNDVQLSKFTDFKIENIFDCDGKQIVKQDFFFIELNNGCKYAVRASGTEPKIKFYIFCETQVQDNLFVAKEQSDKLLDTLKAFLEEDVVERSNFQA